MHGGLGRRGRAGLLHRDAEPGAHHLAALVRQLGVLAQRGQLAQIAEAEEVEELPGRAVQHRPTDLLLLAEDADQRAIHQELERGARVHAADLVDLGARDRLAVRDDRERLELRARQPHRPARDQLLDPHRVGRLGAELVAARDLREHEAAVLVVGLDVLERLLEPADVRHAGQLAESLERDRLVAGEHERLDEVLELDRVHPAGAGRQHGALDGRVVLELGVLRWHLAAGGLEASLPGVGGGVRERDDVPVLVRGIRGGGVLGIEDGIGGDHVRVIGSVGRGIEDGIGGDHVRVVGGGGRGGGDRGIGRGVRGGVRGGDRRLQGRLGALPGGLGLRAGGRRLQGRLGALPGDLGLRAGIRRLADGQGRRLGAAPALLLALARRLRRRGRDSADGRDGLRGRSLVRSDGLDGLDGLRCLHGLPRHLGRVAGLGLVLLERDRAVLVRLGQHAAAVREGDLGGGSRALGPDGLLVLRSPLLAHGFTWGWSWIWTRGRDLLPPRSDITTGCVTGSRRTSPGRPRPGPAGRRARAR